MAVIVEVAVVVGLAVAVIVALGVDVLVGLGVAVLVGVDVRCGVMVGVGGVLLSLLFAGGDGFVVAAKPAFAWASIAGLAK